VCCFANDHVCPEGHYCPGATATPIACGAGTYATGSASTCTPCPAGHSCTVSTTTACLAGQYAAEGAGTCTDCPAGSSCPLGAAAPTPCNPGSYSATKAPSCTPCAAGKYADHSGAVECVTCPPGYKCDVASLPPSACTAGSSVRVSFGMTHLFRPTFHRGAVTLRTASLVKSVQVCLAFRGRDRSCPTQPAVIALRPHPCPSHAPREPTQPAAPALARPVPRATRALLPPRHSA